MDHETNPNDFARVERKVDDLTVAINKLVLFEERQSIQAIAITGLSAQLLQLQQKVDMWINRGVGAWALVATGFAAWKALA